MNKEELKRLHRKLVLSEFLAVLYSDEELIEAAFDYLRDMVRKELEIDHLPKLVDTVSLLSDGLKETVTVCEAVDDNFEYWVVYKIGDDRVVVDEAYVLKRLKQLVK